MEAVDHATAMEQHRAQLASLDPEAREHALRQEQLMRDARQQGNQGNLVMKDGKMQLLSEADMGADCGKYAWGQSETEVSVRVKVPAGTKAKAVKFDVGTAKLKLAVLGETVLDGALFKPVVPDDCTFTMEDEGEGRVVLVTLVKAEKTSASKHWACVCEGEPTIDTSKFGPAIMTADPTDPASLSAILGGAGIGN